MEARPQTTPVSSSPACHVILSPVLQDEESDPTSFIRSFTSSRLKNERGSVQDDVILLTVENRTRLGTPLDKFTSAYIRASLHDARGNLTLSRILSSFPASQQGPYSEDA
jgi:hypothetical protein